MILLFVVPAYCPAQSSDTSGIIEVGEPITLYKIPYLNDHTVTYHEKDAKWHVYGIMEGEKKFIHLTADSLTQTPWVREEDFCVGSCEKEIWAPHIIRHEDTYYMFYTMISAPREIRCATSKDLFHWEHFPEPLLASSNEYTNDQKNKDPMVFRDNDRNQWIMYYSMMKDKEHWVVGYSTSNDLIKWSKPQICFDENNTSPGVESPFVVKRGEYYYLFLSARPWPQGGQDIFRSQSPYFWDTHHPIARIDPWHAAEVIRDRDGEYYLTRATGTLLKNFCIAPIYWHDGLNLHGMEDKKIPVILDTDFGPDYDDAGALAFLHCMADSGYVNILATVLSNRHERSAPSLQAFNTYFNRPDIPIGSPKAGSMKAGSWENWLDTICANYPHSIQSTDEVPDAVTVYRQSLAHAEDNSVVIISIGFLTNLCALLESAPDGYSKLSGIELVRAKVKHLVIMAGEFPTGKEWNIIGDCKASNCTIDHWPTPIIFSGAEVGRNIKTGLKLIHADYIRNNPVKDVYGLVMGKVERDKYGRSSYDQTAVMYAVYGEGDYFKTERGRFLLDANGNNTWECSEQGKHFRIILKTNESDAADFIEERMMHVPAANGLAQDRKLLWSDEFDYDSREELLLVWEAQNAPSTHIVCSRWEENIEVGNGTVKLVNRKENRGGQEWTSASMWTRRNFQYGYFECRYRYASQTGTNNSFWLMTRSRDPEPKAGKRFEIDINEGHYPHEINTNIHNWSDTIVAPDGKKRHPDFHRSFMYEKTDFSKEYHIFGLEWTAGELVFYLDGKEIRREKNNFCFSPAPVMLSEAIISWAGKITDNIDGTYMEIDYVRVYRK
ncbi:MAG: family 16 glycosylhydrolase [Tannerella sp.]|nr:family 16 glycosylhydrolase [Tannerella sp.]